MLDGPDVVINLAGRRVHCRYNEDILKEMMSSRVLSTQILGTASGQCAKPPSVWLQASPATIYAHTFGGANDEATGVLCGCEPGVPKVWNFSIQIAKNWEEALNRAITPNTRKVVLGTAMMMGIYLNDLRSSEVLMWIRGEGVEMVEINKLLRTQRVS